MARPNTDSPEDLAAAAKAAQHILVTNPEDAGIASARRAIKRVWPQISLEGQSYAIGYALGSLRERRRVLSQLHLGQHEQEAN